MKEGIIKAIKFYGIGFGAAVLSHLIFGHPYIHAPSIFFVICFFTLIIGFIWTLKSIWQVLFESKNQKLNGIVITNGIVIISCVLTVILLIYLK